MATLTVQEMNLTGVEITPVAADELGDTFANDGYTFFQVTNGSGSEITVTFNSIRECNQGHDHDIEIVVPNGDTISIGFFSKNRFNNTAGEVEVSYSDHTGVTVAAVKVAR